MHLQYKKGRGRDSGAEERQLKHSLDEDLELVRRAQGDRVATEQLMTRLAPQVRHAVVMAVGRNQEAEDLTHICLLEILENLNSFKGIGSVDAWAGRLAYRVLMRHLSRQRREERTVAVSPLDIGESVDNPEFESTRLKLRDILALHLQKLPENRRMTLILRLAYQYSVTEVAETMGVPVNTVRDRIRIGLKELRQSILRDPQAKDFLKGNCDE